MKRALCVILIALLLTSCASDRYEPDENMRWIDVYYRAEGDKPVASEQRAITIEENIISIIKIALEHMKREPIDAELKTAIPENVEILGVKFDHGTAKINLSDEFLSLDGFDRATAEYAIVMTMSNFWNVQAVELSVQGEVYTPEYSRKSFITEPPKGQS